MAARCFLTSEKPLLQFEFSDHKCTLSLAPVFWLLDHLQNVMPMFKPSPDSAHYLIDPVERSFALGEVSNSEVSARSASSENIGSTEINDVYNFGDLWIDYGDYFKCTLKNFPTHRGLLTQSSFQRKQSGRLQVTTSRDGRLFRTIQTNPRELIGRRALAGGEVSKHFMQPA
jgi:hypothetical protein